MIKIKNILKYALTLGFCFSGSMAYADTFSTVGFETSVSETMLSGSTRDLYEIWYDGGTGASIKTTEFYSDSKSMALEALKPVSPDYMDSQGNFVDVNGEDEYVKINYGSIYTKSIDFSGTSSAELKFRYLITNSSGYTSVNGDFRVEASNDGGETFTTLAVPDELSPIKSTNSAWLAAEKAACVYLILPQAISACRTSAQLVADTGGIPQSALQTYWSSEQVVAIPSEFMSRNTVLRIKSYYENDATNEKTKAYFDNVMIDYTGTAPVLTEAVALPINDALASGRTLFDEASFDSADAADWGIWTDGGRNVYYSAFLAETGTGNVVLRDRYQEGVSNGPGLGEQKSTYSSILTANTDFTRVDDLQIEFSFVPYGIGISDEYPAEGEVTNTYFELSISTNAGVDYAVVETWRAGEHYIDQQRYNVVKSIPGDIVGPEGLTTTTILKIQAYGRDEYDQIYIDNLKVFTIGSRASPAGTPVAFNDGTATITSLQADSSRETYDLINSTFIENYDPTSFEGSEGEVTNFPCIYGSVEHTDLSHPGFGEHILQVYDADLGKDVFAFHVHQDDHTLYIDDDNRAVASPDTDRCRTDGNYDDRQRVEIKTYSESTDTQLGVKGETHIMSWKMKLPVGFQASDKFTHLHQLKPVGGDGSKMPLITLTAVAAKVDEDTGQITEGPMLNLRYSPSHVSQVTITQANLDQMMGKWVHIVEKVTFGLENDGRYEILILDADDLDAEPMMQFASYSLPTWKIDNQGEFIRGKWGIYRSIVQGDMLRDEEVRFADIMIAELNDTDAEYTDLLSFAYYANTISGGTAPTESTSTVADFVGTNGADTITITQGNNVNVIVDVNGTVTELTPLQATSIQINSGSGNDVITVDPDVYYGTLTVYGGSGSDTIIGGNGDDILHGEAGSDKIFGRGGHDYLNGGASNDNFSGGYGADTYVDTEGTHDRAVVDSDDTVTAESTIWKQMDNFIALNVASRELHVQTLVEHLEAFQEPTDVISTTSNDTFSTVSMDFSSTEDVDTTVEGTEAYSFSIPAYQQSLIEHEIYDYEQTGNPDALDEINRLLASDLDTYGKYVLWRLGDTTIGRAVFVYDNYATPQMTANGYTGFSYVGGEGSTYFVFDGDDVLWSPQDDALLEYINSDFTSLLPMVWFEPLGTGEGRYGATDKTWETWTDEAGYFITVEYNGKGTYELLYDDHIISEKTLDGGNQETDDLVYIRNSDTSISNSLYTSTGLEIYHTNGSENGVFERVEEGDGFTKFEVSFSEATVTVTVEKIGYEPAAVSNWVEPSSSSNGDIRVFDMKELLNTMENLPLNSRSFLDWAEASIQRMMHNLLILKYGDGALVDPSLDDLMVDPILTQEERTGYFILNELVMLLEDYVNKQGNLTEAEQTAHDTTMSQIISNAFVQDYASGFQELQAQDDFGMSMLEIAQAIDAFMTSDDDTLEFVDIASKPMKSAFFNSMVALQAQFDPDTAKSTYKTLLQRGMTLDDTTINQRRLESGNADVAFGESIDFLTGMVRLGFALTTSTQRAWLAQYDSLNYGDWKKLAAKLREVALFENTASAKARLETIAQNQTTFSESFLVGFGSYLIDTGLYDLSDGVAAGLSFYQRVESGKDDTATVLGLIGDGFHIAKGTVGLTKVGAFLYGRARASRAGLVEAVETAGIELGDVVQGVLERHFNIEEGEIPTPDEFSSAISDEMASNSTDEGRALNLLANEGVPVENELFDMWHNDQLSVYSDSLSEGGDLSLEAIRAERMAAARSAFDNVNAVAYRDMAQFYSGGAESARGMAYLNDTNLTAAELFDIDLDSTTTSELASETVSIAESEGSAISEVASALENGRVELAGVQIADVAEEGRLAYWTRGSVLSKISWMEKVGFLAPIGDTLYGVATAVSAVKDFKKGKDEQALGEVMIAAGLLTIGTKGILGYLATMTGGTGATYFGGAAAFLPEAPVIFAFIIVGVLITEYASLSP